LPAQGFSPRDDAVGDINLPVIRLLLNHGATLGGCAASTVNMVQCYVKKVEKQQRKTASAEANLAARFRAEDPSVTQARRRARERAGAEERERRLEQERQEEEARAAKREKNHLRNARAKAAKVRTRKQEVDAETEEMRLERERREEEARAAEEARRLEAHDRHEEEARLPEQDRERLRKARAEATRAEKAEEERRKEESAQAGTSRPGPAPWPPNMSLSGVDDPTAHARREVEKESSLAQVSEHQAQLREQENKRLQEILRQAEMLRKAKLIQLGDPRPAEQRLASQSVVGVGGI
jgi:hypothetical protein